MCRSVAGLAGVPGSGEVAHRTPVAFFSPSRAAPAGAASGLRAGLRIRVSPALSLALALAVGWLIVDPRTPDLAAQVYRVRLFEQLGWVVWDERWYAGHHTAGYSLLLGPLASLVGLRLLAVIALLASTALFARLARLLYGPGARWGAAAFAVAAAGDVWIGRISFALGVTCALAAVLALVRLRPLLASGLAALCAAASPVAGLLLALAGATYWLSRQRWLRPGGVDAETGARPRPSAASGLLALGLPATAVAVSLALLFPEGGTEPYPTTSLAATVIVVLAFLGALPRGQRLLRLGALVYLGACVLFVALPTPMGANVERYAVLLAGPLLLLGAARDRSRTPMLLAAALCVWAVWVAWGPVRETLSIASNESTSASYYAPVERYLAAHARGPVRVEVPFTRSHWEAALLAPSVSLARGWEKQLDERYDSVLLSPGLTAASYRRWLLDQAVSYVALPDTPLDPSSAAEGRLIRAGLPYLGQVFASRHWRIYAVRGAAPLASGPGRLTALGHDSFALRALSAGSFLVRVRFSRYLAVASGRACVRAAPGGWTRVIAEAPGTLRVQARFSLAAALGREAACRDT